MRYLPTIFLLGVAFCTPFQARAQSSTPEILRRVPPVPDTNRYPSDSLVVVSEVDSRFVYHRRLLSIRFHASADSADILAFFNTQKARVVGGGPLLRIYHVRIPDPGPTYQELEDKVNEMRSMPGVEYVLKIPSHVPRPRLNIDLPTDTLFGASDPPIPP